MKKISKSGRDFLAEFVPEFNEMEDIEIDGRMATIVYDNMGHWCEWTDQLTDLYNKTVELTQLSDGVIDNVADEYAGLFHGTDPVPSKRAIAEYKKRHPDSDVERWHWIV